MNSTGDADLFVLLLFFVTPVVSALLLWRFARRCYQEPANRWPLAATGPIALILWILGSLWTLMAYADAVLHEYVGSHQTGWSPDSWQVIVLAVIYLAFGAALVMAVGRWPSRKRGERE